MSRRRLAGLAVVGVLVLLFGGRWLSLRYTEHAWYADLGLAGQFWRLLFRAVGWQAATFVASTAWYAAHTLGVYGSIGSVHLPRRVGNLEIAEQVPKRVLRWIALAVALLLGFATAYSFADLDHLVALFGVATPLGFAEPVLGQDASFYLTHLPLLETLHLLATLAVVLAGTLVVALYGLTGSLTVSRRSLRITPHARTHVTLLLATLALVIAWGFHLHGYQIVGGGGAAHGALSAVDRSVRLPAATALSMIALVVSGGSVLATRWVRPVTLIGLWATLGTATLLGRFLIPVLADARGGGSPEAAQAVAGYADGFSRAAFGLLDLRSQDLAPAMEPRADSLAAIGSALSGLSPWSAEPGLLDQAIASARAEPTRSRVWSTTFDRYDGGGKPWLVALAVSQVDQLAAARLVPKPGWSELHRSALAWGSDPVAVDASARAGAPRFLASIAPVDTAARPMPVTRAAGRVRFLPRPADLGVVGPEEGAGDDPAPGLVLGGFLRRLFLAWALQAPPLLDSHTSEADRVLFWRDLPSRLERLYPFATFGIPRAVIVGNRLVWLVDGLLVSARFPLAEHVRWRGDDVNYLSAPYVVTVNATTGATRLYLRPPDLGFAAAVARVEGVEPLPSDSLSPELRRHLGYPAGLFAAQSAVLARRGDDTSHGSGPGWALPAQDSGAAGAAAGDAGMIKPAIALLALGREPTRLWYLLPITDAGGARLAAIVAGTAGDDGALRLLLLKLARSELPTPTTASGRIGASPAVLAAAATAAGVEGAVRRGMAYPIPVGGTVAYAQAIWATPNRASEPMALRGVALLVGSRVGVGQDFTAAAAALVRGDSGAGDVAATASLAEARAAFLALDSAVRRADWALFGRAYQELRRALGLLGGERP